MNTPLRLQSFPALIAGLLLASLLPLRAQSQEKFTLAIIPDSQQEVLRAEDERLQQRMEWIVANREALNLKMVLHVGDLLNWDTPDHIQYERASAAIAWLDKAKIPYAIALGNHDTAATTNGGSAAPGKVNANLRNTATFNTYFPPSRFSALGEVFETGKVDNAYHTFRVGGLDWLVLNLELWARAEAVDWARTVLEKHPSHNVVVLTHSHLTAKSAIEQRNGGYGDNSPQYVFDRLIKEFANVRLVFSGHVGSHGYREDRGAHGNTIHQFLQCYHDNAANPVRLFVIDPNQGTIQTRVYCPSIGQDKTDGSTMTLTNVVWMRSASNQANTHEGVWKPIAAVLGGMRLPSASLKAITLKITGTNYEVAVEGEKEPDQGTCTLDSSTSPKRMTIRSTSGPNRGKTFLAIYEMKDPGSLRVCYDLSGNEFPKEFKALKDTPLYLVGYRRQKE